ncbi:MAG: M48 family metallopeptidase [Sedimentisphaerales bacterium]|nr:M48 family metallopeptidase [Sedimentisphaerales bacterium]
MWELIRVNKRNSIILFVVMAVVLVGLGMTIGAAIDPRAWLLGGLVAAGLWLFLAVLSLSSGDQILLAASRARPVTKEVHPQLFNVVEEMTIAAGLPKMPSVYIIEDLAPNAFATGRGPHTASIAVTAGLLAKLDRDELQGVIAHEISHILHRDILYVTLAGVMLGAVLIVSEVFLRGLIYGDRTGRSRRYSGPTRRAPAQAQMILLLIAVVVAVLAPILAQLLYFALSRQREYLADAGAARLTRYPEGLARALEKIASDTSGPLAVANKATAPMYIVNPFKKGLDAWTSTHPPISERIRILRSLGNTVSLVQYAKAYYKATSRPFPIKVQDESLPVRPGQPGGLQANPKDKDRQAADLIRKVHGFRFLSCPCGLTLKVPPNYTAGQISCPRCGRRLVVAQSAAGAD